MSMDVNEFKIRLMRGLIRPEYFYIPVLSHESIEGIFIELTDQYGSPAYFKGLYITYATDSLFHDLHWDGSAWIQDHDAGYKGYAFLEDFEWRYPPAVPNPSEYEIYPLPDFTQSPPQTDVDSEDVTVYSVGSTYINFGFAKAVSKVEIKNLPVGNYKMSVEDVVVPENYTYNGVTYYPDMYAKYDEDHPVDHVSGLCQVDRNSKFSGYAKLNLFDSSDRHPTGYDFYCITDKFPKNTMPVVARLIPPEPPPHYPTVRFELFWYELDGWTGRRFRGNVYNGYMDDSGNYSDVDGAIIDGELKLNKVRLDDYFTPQKILTVRIFVDEQYKGVLCNKIVLNSWQDYYGVKVEDERTYSLMKYRCQTSVNINYAHTNSLTGSYSFGNSTYEIKGGDELRDGYSAKRPFLNYTEYDDISGSDNFYDESGNCSANASVIYAELNSGNIDYTSEFTTIVNSNGYTQVYDSGTKKYKFGAPVSYSKTTTYTNEYCRFNLRSFAQGIVNGNYRNWDDYKNKISTWENEVDEDYGSTAAPHMYYHMEDMTPEELLSYVTNYDPDTSSVTIDMS